MQDPQLDRYLAEAKELKELWQLYREYFKLGLRGEGMTRENDAKFLEVKSRVAMLHDAFMETVRGQDSRQVGQNIMALISRAISLRHLNRLSDVDIKKIDLEWNECFLLLNEQIGTLEDKVEKLAAINPAVYKFKKFKAKSAVAAKNFFKGAFFKFILFAGVAVGAVALFVAFGAGEYMKKTGPLKPLYYGGVGFYRTFVDKTYPYDNIDRFMASTRNMTASWTEKGDGKYDPVEVLGTFHPDIANKLATAPEHRSRQWAYKPAGGLGGEMDVHIWRFNTTAEGYEVFEKYRSLRKAQTDARTVSGVESRRKLRRVLNCIIVYYHGSDSMHSLMDDNMFHGAEKP